MNSSDEVDGGVDEDGDIGDAGGGGRLPGDDLRNLRFKLLPAIIEGPWIVRKAVGSKPTLIAQKVGCEGFIVGVTVLNSAVGECDRRTLLTVVTISAEQEGVLEFALSATTSMTTVGARKVDMVVDLAVV